MRPTEATDRKPREPNGDSGAKSRAGSGSANVGSAPGGYSTRKSR